MELGYLGLFLASFLAATVVPFSSEVIFSAMVFGGLDAWTCVWVATLGNWMGGMTSYYVGLLGKIEWIEKYFRIKKEKMESYTKQNSTPCMIPQQRQLPSTPKSQSLPISSPTTNSSVSRVLP